MKKHTKQLTKNFYSNYMLKWKIWYIDLNSVKINLTFIVFYFLIELLENFEYICASLYISIE